jgi:serine protease AprX
LQGGHARLTGATPAGAATRWKEALVRSNNHTHGKRRLARAAMTAALTLAVAAMSSATPVARDDEGGAGIRSGGWASNIWLGGASTAKSLTLANVRTIIGADTGPAATLTGAGVGVALIDTGVTPVPGLPAAQVVNGPDLSFESQSASLRYLDTYGHGTHMAGIIVGNDSATGTKGLAPKAKLTSIKVGTSNGAVDVSQMIAAVDWVVAHRNDDPANRIRVLNLSYGSGGNPNFWSDPLSFAVQRAWKAGIVVVAAAGNDGNSSARLANPASDLVVIGVAASTTKGTVSTDDDELSTYSNMATSEKTPDLLAPGQSIASLRVPGSNIDNTYPGARSGDTLFRGSGTSQAAAVTSAAVALLLQARPNLNPDQVKDLLRQGTFMKIGTAASRGIREINVNAALSLTPTTTVQTWGTSDASGTLDSARGGSRVVRNGVALSGQNTVFGPFDGAAWSKASAAGTAWQGGSWMGRRLAGDGWTGTSFASKTWAGAAWSMTPWDSSTASWVDPNWSGRSWSGRSWSAGTWNGNAWSSEDWAATSWG